GLGIDFNFLRAGIGVMQDVQALGISRHDAVLDSVVDHLDEMTGSARSAMQISLLGRAVSLIATGCSGRGSDPGSKGGEDWLETLDHVWFAANHQTISVFRTPDPAAGPNIDIVDTLRLEFARAANVVDVVGIASVNDGVAGLHAASKFVQSLIDDSGRHHQPSSTRRLQLGHEVIERGGSGRTFTH